MNLLKRLWRDEVGAVMTTELVLISSVAVMGTVAGLTEVRDATVSELSDLAAAVSSIDQSYSYTGVSRGSSYSAGSAFQDSATSSSSSGSVATTCTQLGTQ